MATPRSCACRSVLGTGAMGSTGKDRPFPAITGTQPGGSMTDTNRRVLLKSRPQGEPTRANFDVVDAPVPEPRTASISRARSGCRSIPTCAAAWPRPRATPPTSSWASHGRRHGRPGGEVEHPEFKEGDYRRRVRGWQSHAVSNGAGVDEARSRRRRRSRPRSGAGHAGHDGVVRADARSASPSRARRWSSRRRRARSARSSASSPR